MNKIVGVISTQLDNLSRRLIKTIGFGKEDIQETQQAMPYGDDSNPIKDMIAIYSPTTDIGNPIIIGYINRNQIADVGEKRIFSTDTDGNVVMALHLKNDGTAEFGGDSDNMMRFANTKLVTDELKSDINSLKNILATWVPIPADGGAALKTLLATYFATPIAESIDPSKIDEIKTS